MHNWLEMRADTTPHRVALLWNGQSWTYRQLADEVALLANQLAVWGVTPRQVVGVYMANSPQYVMLIHALMRLGAVLLPLNTRLTEHEVSFQLETANAGLLLVAHDDERQRLTAIAPCPIRVLSVDATANRLNAMHTAFVDVVLEQPAAIVFTSGTSGTPKGAVLTYGNFFYSAMASAYHLGTLPDDRWLCVLPLYHVGGLSIVFRAVLYGITLALHPRFELEAIDTALKNTPITLISLVPTMLYRLLQHGQPDKWTQTLRCVLLGGAAATSELMTLAERHNVPIATTYGLTEACSQVATLLPADARRKPGSVGKSLPFMSVRIMNDQGQSAAPGEYGEVVVSGPTLMREYIGNPEATQRVLRNGALHTGDIGYLDNDGDLWIVQRRTDLIVSGGENVYPAEVEALLRQHPAVRDVAVVGLPDAEWGQTVAAVVVPIAPHVTLDASELSAFARQQLAGYKLPRRWLFADALPQTASGKIQRHALKALFDAADD